MFGKLLFRRNHLGGHVRERGFRAMPVAWNGRHTLYLCSELLPLKCPPQGDFGEA